MLYKFLKMNCSNNGRITPKDLIFTSVDLEQNLQKFSSIVVVKKQFSCFLQHCKYEISKILYPQKREQSLPFLRIFICQSCICIILSPMNVSAPAADLLNVSIQFDRSLHPPKRVHSPATGEKSDVFFSVVIMHLNLYK